MLTKPNKLMQWPRLLLFFACFQVVVASSGDRSPEFIHCVSLCTDLGCPHPFSLPLRLTRWTCLDDCRYHCTHQVTDLAIQHGSRVHQFFGKWAFWRFAGAQEPASVIFSLLNFWAHANAARKIRRKLPDSHPMKYHYVSSTFVGMNAWFWSAVFHTRDTPTTEKLDYFSAALTIIYALYCTVIRLFHLYTIPQNSSNDKSTLKTTLSVFFISVYLMHVAYLSLLPRFDYTYNMAFNVALGLVHNLLWLLYALPPSVSVLHRFSSRPRSYRPRFVNKPMYLVTVTILATGLELFDFPPWLRVIDAHALWHLATAPIAVYWYRFLLDDASDSSWRDHKL